ncbi:TPA: hypothetical protein R4Y92_001390 [Klebsiella aerogenes]|nr:hypothetical protein [Klebsiella aerogenes]
MNFDCLVIKANEEPFIHQVKSEVNPFDLVYDESKTYETFTITRIEHPDKKTGKLALYLVANKAGIPREEIGEIIDLKQPSPVKLFD